jgi:hypothetical protein
MYDTQTNFLFGPNHTVQRHMEESSIVLYQTSLSNPKVNAMIRPVDSQISCMKNEVSSFIMYNAKCGV